MAKTSDQFVVDRAVLWLEASALALLRSRPPRSTADAAPHPRPRRTGTYEYARCEPWPHARLEASVRLARAQAGPHASAFARCNTWPGPPSLLGRPDSDSDSGPDVGPAPAPAPAPALAACVRPRCVSARPLVRSFARSLVRSSARSPVRGQPLRESSARPSLRCALALMMASLLRSERAGWREEPEPERARQCGLPAVERSPCSAATQLLASLSA